MTAFEPIPDPLKDYSSTLKGTHHENTVSELATLVEKSGVDREANKRLCQEIKTLEEKIGNAKSRLGRWRFLRNFIVLLTLGLMSFGGYYGYFVLPTFSDKTEPIAILSGVGVGAILLLFWIFKQLNPKISHYTELTAALEHEHQEKLSEAWQQMAPLNSLLQWDTINNLVMKTVPQFTLDRFLSEERFSQLCDTYHLAPNLYDPCISTLSCLSGAVFGNPFIILGQRYQEWGEKTYTGELYITWTETEYYTDSNGRRASRTVRKSQTLHASVTKPIPIYPERKFLIYGHHTTPDLTFTREPSEISALGDTRAAEKKISKEVKALEKKSRTPGSTFMLMTNETFEVLFGATDRNNEHQFRQLFTPFAQQTLTTLLRDKEVGYGDNFIFVRDHMVNILEPSHLMTTELSISPQSLSHYSLEMLETNFVAVSDNYFRSLFFAFAPLLSIPLLQEEGTYEETPCRIKERACASAYEHEVLANTYPVANFDHEDACTETILKTEVHRRAEGASEIEVTAHSFTGITRTDYVSVKGRDGRWHKVPVEWIEYLPVKRTSSMMVHETTAETYTDFQSECVTPSPMQEILSNYEVPLTQVNFKKFLASFLVK